jgi:hypothetical protein
VAQRTHVVAIMRQIGVFILAVAGIVLAAAVLWFVFLVRAAHAHDGYEWIMNEPRYVDRTGVHCCSRDCAPVDPALLLEVEDGIIYRGNEKLLYRERGIYRSEEPGGGPQRWWVCRRHNKAKCIFRPRPDT